jgi:hypothetical protein
MQHPMDKQGMPYAMQHELLLVCMYSVLNKWHQVEVSIVDYDINYQLLPKFFVVINDNNKRKFLPIQL